MRIIDWNKYLFAFVITAAIFATAIFASTYFDNKRIAEVQAIEDKIAVDILALETQFDLLEDLSCEAISENSVLSSELNSLERRLAFTEGQLGTDNAEVERLKRSYSLLQIKDYLLMKRVSEKCNLDPIFIFYFYSNAGDCDECTRAGHVLTHLREQYPKLRVYSFDYNLDLSALQTLITVNNIEGNTLPAIVINDEVKYGFQSVEALEEVLPVEDLRDPEDAEEKATTSTENSASLR